MTLIHRFLFDIYPYLAGTIFFVGCWLRYDHDQYGWRAGSSQLLRQRHLRWALNLFHIGILGIIGGHLFGLLTPHELYHAFISVRQKQLLAMILGGIFGLMTLMGGGALCYRRLTDPRLKATSTRADQIIIILLVLQAFLGLITIPLSAQHLDGQVMLNLSQWAQHIFTFRAGASEYLYAAPLLFKCHLVLGITLFVLFPFSRLVHVWSVPLGYFTRCYQVVRQRRY